MAKVKPKTLTPAEDKPVDKAAEATAPRVPKKDKENDAIRQFLVGCQPFEAETIRILVARSGSEDAAQTLCDSDEFTLNCYLNVGFKKNTDSCSDALIAHRQSRVVPVAMLASPFLDKGQILPSVGMLLQLASSEKSVTAFLKRTKGTPLAAMADGSQAKPKPKKDAKTSDGDAETDSSVNDTPISPSLFGEGVSVPAEPEQSN